MQVVVIPQNVVTTIRYLLISHANIFSSTIIIIIVIAIMILGSSSIALQIMFNVCAFCAFFIGCSVYLSKSSLRYVW